MSDANDFERILRAALERKEPGPDFTEHVLAAVEQRHGPNLHSQWRNWVAGCLAASLLVGTLGIRQVEDRRERERGKAAGEQLVQALAITSHTLQRIQKKLDGLNHE